MTTSAAKAKAVSFDPVWEEKYKAGHQERAPWDAVVSFIFRHRPRDKDRSETKILEVGCGTGSNLWFAALEGFGVAGLDGSAAAIEMAQQRFEEDGLVGDLRVGDFTKLPFADGEFDLVIDRGALTCAGSTSQKMAIEEIYRVLRPGGKFFYNPYSDLHTSFRASSPGKDDTRVDIREGALVGVGQIHFVSLKDIPSFVPENKWDVLSIHLVSITDVYSSKSDMTAYWRVIAQKKV
jgi:SAM-dependent methyltransferase